MFAPVRKPKDLQNFCACDKMGHWKGRGKMEFHTANRAETAALGERLGRALRAGDIVALNGPMGAGKTAFAGGVAQGLDVSDPVTSPTYTIVNEYAGRLPLLHFDLYRLTGMDDLYDIGWEDYLARGGVILAEWPQIAGEDLEPTVFVNIQPTGETTRCITITGGTGYADLSL